jgi:hypothetical protein
LVALVETPVVERVETPPDSLVERVETSRDCVRFEGTDALAGDKVCKSDAI